MSCLRGVLAWLRLAAGVAALAALPATATADEPIVLQYWTWFPDAKTYEPVIRRFEELNPGIRIQLTSLDNKSVQEKVPLALTTGEAVDIVGVQPQMGSTIKDYVLDLEPLLTQVQPDWQQHYAARDIADSKRTTGGVLKYITLVRFGSMIGYYNADLFRQYGLTVPKTLADFRQLALTLKRKAPGILPAAINGKDSWTMQEMLFTLMGQRGDYYNRIVYNTAPLNTMPTKMALREFKAFFDQGVFTKDVFDFDYGRSQEMFTSGRAATYFQGTWEAWLLSPRLRRERRVEIGDVGAFALPMAGVGSQPALNSFIEVGTAIAKSSKHPREAAKFIAFLQFGEGTDLIARRMVGTFGKTGVALDPALFDAPAGAQGIRLMADLVAHPAADRFATAAMQRFNGFDRAISEVLQGDTSVDDATEALNDQWRIHARKTSRRPVAPVAAP